MKLFYIFFLLCLPSILFAQSNYYEGYVLKNNGDTLKGYINYHEWTKSPISIDFKINKSDKKDIEFTPETIKGFQISGMETYISYIGMISIDKNEFPNVPVGLDTTQRQEPIFLRQIATGKYLTLYYNSDKIKTRYFISEANNRPVELQYHVYYNNYPQIVSSNIYKGQLILLVNKYAGGKPSLISMAENATYDQTRLEPLVNKINNLNNSSNGNVKKASLSRFYIGLALNSTKTQVDYVYSVSDVRNSTTVSPKINLGIDIFNNPYVQQFIFRTELSFSYIKPRYYDPVTINSGIAKLYEFNQYTATITPQVLLNIYNKDKFKFYVDGGWAFNFSHYTNNKITIANENGYTTNNPFILESFWSDFPLQAGFVLDKKIEIYANYTPFATYTQYDSYYASNQSINLGIKWLLK